MEKVLKLYKYIDGINDSPFPSESEQIVVANFRYDAKRMSSAPTIVFTSMHRTCLDDLWSDNVYAIFNGERYFIKQTPTSSYSNADTRYKHEVELISERSILDNVFFYDVVTEDGVVDKPVSNSPKFSFYGDIHEYVSRLNHSLSFSGLEYSIVVDEGVNSDESLVSFDNQVITNALQEIYNIYNIPYYFNGKVIHVGYYKDDINYVFKYGANDSLISISKQNANSKIINRITGVGSSDNIPYYYPNDDARGITRPLLNGGAYGVSVINTIKYKKLRLTDELKYYSSINELVPLLNDGVFEVSNIKHLGLDESTGLTRYMIDFYYTFTLDASKKVKFDIWSIDTEKTEDLKYNISKEGGQNFGYFSGETTLDLNNGTYTLIVRWLFLDEQPVLENDESTYNFINLYVGVSSNIVVEASESWTLKGLPILLSDYGLNVDSASNGDVITVELLSYIQPQQNLMPPIYRYFLERFYEAKDNTFVDDKTGDYYVFENEYSTTHPREHIENFDNIKPTIKNVTNEHGDRIDRFVDFAYDLDDNDETDQDGNFYHPYFFAKLNKTNGIKGFNLFEHSIDESDMTISVTSGSCGSCEFIIGVDENTQKNLVQVDEYGDLLRDSNGNVRCGRKGMQKETPQDVQNDTENNEVWIALKKDIQTFGVVMPNATNNYKPSIGDTFVILHIDLPKTYIEEAEKKLEQELIRYMHDNNAEKFNFSISFSRIFFAENPSILERLSENSKIKIEYNKQVYELYASSLSYSISNDLPFPEIKIDLNDAITISQNQINQVVNSAKKDIISSIKKDVLWGDIKGVPSWITSEKPKYSYNEILGSVPQEESDVWVIKKDSNGNAYLFTTFPVVTQYGITMYSGDGVDVPSLASGLPFDGRTIWYNPDTQQIEVIGGTGGGSGEGVSNFWDLSGIPSWITNSKPKYSYSEIEGTPDLSGFATQNWIISQGYASAEELKKYIPISGYTEVSGEKNFTGGLKVNGSPIYYDTEKKYWKLEGDLLVTGGVTMYGSDSSFTPSTIMDALLYDDTTLGINSNGQLYVKGGTSGGGLDITALQNYLTSNSYLNVTSGDNRYLQLSGGTINVSSGNPYIGYANSGANLGRIGVTTSFEPFFYSSYTGANNTIWHSGNDGSGSGLDADLLDGKHLSDILASNVASATKATYLKTQYSNSTSWYDDYLLYAKWATDKADHLDIKIDGYYTRVDVAKKLNTARTIWGQSFDGTGDVYGDFIQRKYGAYGGNGSEFNIYNKAVADVDGREGSLRWVFENAYARFRRLEIWSQEGATSTRLAYFSNSAWSFYTGIGDSMFCGGHAEGYALYVGSRISDANKYLFTVKYGQSTLGVGGNTALHVRGDGNVGVNTDSTRCKFSVISVGTGSNPSLGALATVNTIGFGDNAYKTYFWTRGTGNGYIQVGREDGNTTAYNLILQALGGNVGVGKEDPQHKVDIVGNVMVSSGWYRSKGAYGWYSEDYAGGWYMTDAAWIRNYNSKPLLLEIGTNNTNGIGGNRVGLTLRGASHCSIMMIGTNGGAGYGWGIAANADGNFYVGRRTGESAGYSSSTDSYKFRLDGSGNGLFYGGVTMYSDQRKKTILNHVELSLKQIADAPLIEHYYNSDEKKTTHVGSIAQYWASMNDWFCKLDSEGYYTMEIQNAALASAISIARELDRYETKTDKAIKMLKKRICELEEEVERLKSA